MDSAPIRGVIRQKAHLLGADTWLAALPGLMAELAAEWSLSVTRMLPGGTESVVTEVVQSDGEPAVLKLLIPRRRGRAADHELTALTLDAGRSCVRVLRADPIRNAMLLEQLGPSLSELGRPMRERHEIMCATALRLWRPAAGSGLPTGKQKASRLIDFVTSTWEELDRPCSVRSIDDAVECAGRRWAAHDDERSELVHGDLHQGNVLRDGESFKLIDPDGLLAEREYDLGIIMREDPVELLNGDPFDRACWLANRCDADAAAVWDWGVVERVSTGLFATQVGQRTVGRAMLATADAVAGLRFS